MKPRAIHNRDAGKIVDSIVRPTLSAGGKYSDVLVLLESVVTGVMLYGALSSDDIEITDKMLDTMVKNVRERVKEGRLTLVKTEGHA